MSKHHCVCPDGYFVVLVATSVETSSPHQELKPGLDLLGPIQHLLYSVADLYEPIKDGTENNVSL